MQLLTKHMLCSPVTNLYLHRSSSNAPFQNCSELKRRALIKSALSRHGLAGASEAKKRRAIASAEAEADEALALARKKAKLSDATVAADDLTGGLAAGLNECSKLRVACAHGLGFGFAAWAGEIVLGRVCWGKDPIAILLILETLPLRAVES
jgi:hypothetical protein